MPRPMDVEIVNPTKPIITHGRLEIPFTRIANGNRYPNGSPLSALTMLLNQQGIMYTRDYLYEEYIEGLCDKNFKKELGVSTPEFGPEASVFAGDMKSTGGKVNANGCSLTFFRLVWSLLINNEEGLRRVANISDVIFGATNTEIRRCLENDGSIVIALIRTSRTKAEISWKSMVSDHLGNPIVDPIPVRVDQNTKWIVLYGYTDTHWLVYDPASNKNEEHRFNPGYNLIEEAFSIRRR
jgi:hypothetical protein